MFAAPQPKQEASIFLEEKMVHTMIRRLLHTIHMYYEGKQIWDAKMSEPLGIRIVFEPEGKLPGAVDTSESDRYN